MACVCVHTCLRVCIPITYAVTCYKTSEGQDRSFMLHSHTLQKHQSKNETYHNQAPRQSVTNNRQDRPIYTHTRLFLSLPLTVARVRCVQNARVLNTSSKTMYTNTCTHELGRNAAGIRACWEARAGGVFNVSALKLSIKEAGLSCTMSIACTCTGPAPSSPCVSHVLE